MKITIEKSTLKDSLFFYNLRNSNYNRKLSFNTSKINTKEHAQWYSQNFKKNIFYTCYFNKEKSGYIRGDFREDTLLISIAFLKKFQNRSISSKSYKLFEKKIPKNTILIAKVKNTNLASKNFFLKNKYVLLHKKKAVLIYYKIYLDKKIITSKQ